MALDPDGTEWSEFMLITDDIGRDDGSYRVVYNPAARTFGTITRVEGGRVLYLGADATFAAAVADM